MIFFRESGALIYEYLRLFIERVIPVMEAIIRTAVIPDGNAPMSLDDSVEEEVF